MICKSCSLPTVESNYKIIRNGQIKGHLLNAKSKLYFDVFVPFLSVLSIEQKVLKVDIQCNGRTLQHLQKNSFQLKTTKKN